MRGKNAVSPLIATVIVLAVTVTAGILLYSTLWPLVSKQIASTACSDISFKLDIDSTCGINITGGKELQISIDRTGSSLEEPEVIAWRIVLDSGEGSKITQEQQWQVNPGEQRTFSLVVSQAMLQELNGDVSGIAVFPVIQEKRTRASCTGTVRGMERLKRCISASGAASTFENGLVGYWSFERYDNTSVFDSSPSNYTGTFSAGNAYQNIAPGFSGQGLKTSETGNAYLNILKNNLLSSSAQPFTIMAWFKHNAGLQGNLSDQSFGGIEKRDAQVRLGWSGYGSAFDGDGWNCKLLSGDSGPAVTMPYTVEPNKWDLIACTYDGQKLRLYINGELVGTRTVTGTSFGGNDIVTLGESRYGDTWNGMIDEARIYNRSLTTQEIRSFLQSYLNTTNYNEQAKSSDEFADSVGVNLHDWPNFTTVVAPALGESGIKHVRETIFKTNIPRQESKIASLAPYGIKWGWIAESRFITPSETLQTIKTMKTDLGYDFIDYVEGPNEPDNFQRDVPNIIQLTRQYTIDLYNNFTLDPQTASIPLVAPSMSTVGGLLGIGDISPWVDYANGHIYTNPAHPGFVIVDRYLEYHKIPVPGKSMKVTETGSHTSDTRGGGYDGVSEYVQAKYTPRGLFELYNRGMDSVYIYGFMNDGTNASDYRHNSGLLHLNGTRKPAFYAVKNTIALLREPNSDIAQSNLRYSITSNHPQVHHTLLQKSNGDFYLVLWLEISSTDVDEFAQVRISFATPISRAEVYSPTESTNIVQTFQNPSSIDLNIPDKILIVKLAQR